MRIIKLAQEINKYFTHSLKTTANTLGQRCDQYNKRAADVETTIFEVKKLGTSSRNEVQILNITLNQINSHMSSVEAGAYPAIYKVQMIVSDLMTLKI